MKKVTIIVIEETDMAKGGILDSDASNIRSALNDDPDAKAAYNRGYSEEKKQQVPKSSFKTCIFCATESKCENAGKCLD